MLPYEAHFLGYHFSVWMVIGYIFASFMSEYAHFYSSMVHVFNFLRHKHNHIPIVLMF